MSVIFRSDRKKWQASVFVRGKRKRPLFLTKKEAEDFVREVRLGRLGLKNDSKSITISDAFAEYFREKSKGKTKVSRTNDRRYFNLAFHFFEMRGVEYLDQIKVRDLQALQKWLLDEHTLGSEKKLAWTEATVNRAFHTLKHFFGRQVEWGNLDVSPADHLSLLPESESAQRPMSAAEFDAVYSMSQDWFRPILMTLRITGARPSSIARLQWRHVDLARGVMTLISKKGKGSKTRLIPVQMIDELFQIMVELRNRYRFAADDDLVFRNESNQPISAEWISRVGNRLVRACGFKGLVLYGLRHSLATDLTSAGVPTEIVRQALGHSNIRTTQIYARGIGLSVVKDAVNLVRGVAPNGTNEKENVALGGTGI